MKKYERSNSETKFICEKKVIADSINKNLNYLTRNTRVVDNNKKNQEFQREIHCKESVQLFLINQSILIKVYFKLRNFLTRRLMIFKKLVNK